MESQLAAEYLELWDRVLASLDEYMPEVIATGLATTQSKMSVDTLDAMREKHAAIADLKKELKRLDNEHSDLLAKLKQQKRPFAEGNEGTTRVADFIMGLIVSLQRDFAQNAELAHIMQNLYLFQQSDSKGPTL